MADRLVSVENKHAAMLDLCLTRDGRGLRQRLKLLDLVVGLRDQPLPITGEQGKEIGDNRYRGVSLLLFMHDQEKLYRTRPERVASQGIDNL